MWNLIFSILIPENRTNFISRRFARWRSRKRELLLVKQLPFAKEESHIYDVPGAGFIAVSKYCGVRTGKALGFSLGCSWSHAGLIGGVLGFEEARRLANHLLDASSKYTLSESQELEKIKIKEQEYIDSLR